ncbi:hypothetical protein VP01_340g6 [Puccinia sorghi]|uniref:Uncharacterized protein n=1 Tax=Puccinia sorghi TaxID=27349 RepID=A0A0L6UWH5_9BASI|nr:hypothetical protein VP01_340g6 [Puccinia sorghi]
MDILGHGALVRALCEKHRLTPSTVDQGKIRNSPIPPVYGGQAHIRHKNRRFRGSGTIMKLRLLLFGIFLSFCISFLPSTAEGYLITTTVNQIDVVSAALAKQDEQNFHICAPKLVEACFFPSGHLDVDAVLDLIAARLSYIPFARDHSASKHSTDSINPPSSRIQKTFQEKNQPQDEEANNQESSLSKRQLLLAEISILINEGFLHRDTTL